MALDTGLRRGNSREKREQQEQLEFEQMRWSTPRRGEENNQKWQG